MLGARCTRSLVRVGVVEYAHQYTLRMIELLNRHGAKHYIKKELQPYLPAGYPNPLRIVQHH